MKIDAILERDARSREDRDLDKTPAAGNLGTYMTTAQAAVELGVSMSRIRQFIRDGRLKSENKPSKGQRDHLLKASQVRAFKKKVRKRTGRPPKDDSKKE